MAEKLKIISLGGLNEVGKNITVFEYKNDILVVDCGVGFPDGEMYGVDILSCPYHELARDLGCEKAVLCICHMDKSIIQTL